MKHFKLEIEDVNYEWELQDANDVMYQIGIHPGCEFRIYWKSPVTGGWVLIVEKNADFIMFSEAFELPKTFNKLVSM